MNGDGLHRSSRLAETGGRGPFGLAGRQSPLEITNKAKINAFDPLVADHRRAQIPLPGRDQLGRGLQTGSTLRSFANGKVQYFTDLITAGETYDIGIEKPEPPPPDPDASRPGRHVDRGQLDPVRFPHYRIRFWLVQRSLAVQQNLRDRWHNLHGRIHHDGWRRNAPAPHRAEQHAGRLLRHVLDLHQQ